MLSRAGGQDGRRRHGHTTRRSSPDVRPTGSHGAVYLIGFVAGGRSRGSFVVLLAVRNLTLCTKLYAPRMCTSSYFLGLLSFIAFLSAINFRGQLTVPSSYAIVYLIHCLHQEKMSFHVDQWLHRIVDSFLLARQSLRPRVASLHTESAPVC